ncbi:SURF1 family protein [Arthrobacter sp. L77]|uniref:SURF1 family protein n=1 Tax=Arthrobacter sp. L77 TaxID=1496689 RepID=UPI0005BBBBDD|nr:SURF1 family protein [Arthrobacter sp. L77]
MLKTALKPRWILLLVLAMAIASVFVLLSQWQFNSSRQAPPPAPSTTEDVRPLTDVLQPLTPLYASGADQMVSLDGTFLPDTRTLVQDRVRDGEEGLWVIQAFAVDGAATPAGDAGQDAVIPIVLGWVPAAEDASSLPEQEGPAAVVGRLLPPEAPLVQRPVEGQVPSLSTAELANRWDARAYAAFVVATTVTAGGVDVPFAAGMEPVVVGPQPQETPINWLNIFYAIEWFVFAGFAFFLWWRLVADDHRRALEDAEDAAEAGAQPSPGTRSDAMPAASSEMRPDTEGGMHRD